MKRFWRLGAMGPLLWRVILRPLRNHPGLALLNLLSVALGVAVFTSILTANRSATAAFRTTVGLVTGTADLEVRGNLPEEVWPEIVRLRGVGRATPTVEWIGLLPAWPGEYLRIVGVDPFTSGDLRGFSLAGWEGRELDLEEWLRAPDAVAIFATARERWERSGGKLALDTPVGRRDLRPVFQLQARDESAGIDSRLAVMDLAWAQELSGQPGRLSSILVELDGSVAVEEVRASIESLLPGDATVEPPAGRTKQTEGMLASFQLNLLALSLVSMLVGCYLIYNAVAASVLRRRLEIGILRAVGSSRVFLRSIFLVEAGVLGLIGAVLGLLLSLPLTGILTGLVARTISSLYVLLSIEKPVLSAGQIGLGLALGTGAAVMAAWFPAGEATRVDPREVLHPGHLEERARPHLAGQFFLGFGALLLAGGAGWLALALEQGWIGFLSAFLVVAGCSLLIPASTDCLVRWIAPSILGRAPVLGLALQNLGRALSRNSFTIAAVAAALAMVVSISVMIHSFRGSVNVWMERTLVADLFVAPAANEIAGMRQPLPAGVLEMIEGSPGVESLGTFREETLVWEGRSVSLGIFSGNIRGELEFLEGDSARRSAELDEGKGVAVSESFASRFRVKEGDALTIPLPGGAEILPVVGTYRDYTRDGGVVLLGRSIWLAAGGDEGIQSVAIFLREGSSAGEMEAALRTVPGNSIPLSIYANRALKERIGEIFSQTFAVTGVLRLIALVVAVTGILLGLGILVRERARDTGVLRSMGASRGQIFTMVLGEAGAIGLIACFFGLLSGSLLSLVLTFIINKAYFGWTVSLAYPMEFLLFIPVWVLAVAVLAGIWPAWLAVRQAPGEVLRSE